MRITHLISGYAPAHSLGGPVESTRLLCAELASSGSTVLVLTTTEGQSSKSAAVSVRGWQSYEGVPVRYCQRLPGLGWSAEYLWHLPTVLARTDVAHVTGTFSVTAFASMVACVRSSVPFVVSPRGSLEKWALGAKRWKKTPALGMLRPLLDRASAIHATSELEAKGLLAIGLRAPVVVVPNPVAVPPVAMKPSPAWRERLGLAPTSRILLMLGRLHPVKGADVAIEALRLLDSNVVLVLAGPGDAAFERALLGDAEKKGVVDRIRRVPLVTGQEKYSLLREADVLLLPSRQENFGNVVVEALSVETPVVASRATPWELLEVAGCGRWVELDPGAFANAVTALLAAPDGMEAARKRAGGFAARFRSDLVAQDMMSLYEAVLSHAQPPFRYTSDT